MLVHVLVRERLPGTADCDYAHEDEHEEEQDGWLRILT